MVFVRNTATAQQHAKAHMRALCQGQFNSADFIANAHFRRYYRSFVLHTARISHLPVSDKRRSTTHCKGVTELTGHNIKIYSSTAVDRTDLDICRVNRGRQRAGINFCFDRVDTQFWQRQILAPPHLNAFAFAHRWRLRWTFLMLPMLLQTSLMHAFNTYLATTHFTHYSSKVMSDLNNIFAV